MASNGLSLGGRVTKNDTADLRTIPDFEHPFLCKKTALVIIDFQNDLISACTETDVKSVLQNTEKVVAFARESSVDVIFTRFVGDTQRLGPAWLHRDVRCARSFHCYEGSYGAEIHPVIEPRPNEHIFNKNGIFDPFLLSEFDEYISKLGVEHLILAGLYGDLGVDAAARSAFQRGMFVTVVEDATSPFYSVDWASDKKRMCDAYGARLAPCGQLTRMLADASWGTDFRKPEDSSIWFKQDIGPRLADSIRSVYLQWTGLEGELLEKHLHEIRQKAWQLFDYPCVGLWMFLMPSLTRLPWFKDLVEGLKQGPNSDGFILDMGTFLGQDLRLLATQGIPTSRMRGLDRDERPWELGYELFSDRAKFDGQFIHNDFLVNAESEAEMYGLPWQDHITSMTPFTARKAIRSSHSKDDALVGFSPECLEPLNRRCSVIICNMFIHLYSLPQQTIMCIRITRLSRPGTVVIGYQGGRRRASTSKKPWGTMFHHSPDTWRDMWKVVEMVTGTKWRIDARLVTFEAWGQPKEDSEWRADDEMGLDFCCERLK